MIDNPSDSTSRKTIAGVLFEQMPKFCAAYGKRLCPDLLDAYFSVLFDLEPDDVAAAFERALRERATAPAPAVLRRFAREVGNQPPVPRQCELLLLVDNRA